MKFAFERFSLASFLARVHQYDGSSVFLVPSMLVSGLFSFPKISVTYVRRPIFCRSHRKLTLCMQWVFLDDVHCAYDLLQYVCDGHTQFCGCQLFMMIHAVIPDCRWAPLGDKCPQTIHRPAVDGAPSMQNPTIPPREFCIFPCNCHGHHTSFGRSHVQEAGGRTSS